MCRIIDPFQRQIAEQHCQRVANGAHCVESTWHVISRIPANSSKERHQHIDGALNEHQRLHISKALLVVPIMLSGTIETAITHFR